MSRPGTVLFLVPIIERAWSFVGTLLEVQRPPFRAVNRVWSILLKNREHLNRVGPVLTGILLALYTKTDVLVETGYSTFPTLVGMVLTGVVAGMGAQVVHWTTEILKYSKRAKLSRMNETLNGKKEPDA